MRLDHKEGGALKNWCLQTVVMEKTPVSPLDSKEIKLVNLKVNQSWILIGRTDAEAEGPIFWLSDVNSWLFGKVPDAGKHWEQKEKRESEDKMAGWHHQYNGHELEDFARQWGTERPGLLQSMGLQRVGHNWVTEQQHGWKGSILWRINFS